MPVNKLKEIIHKKSKTMVASTYCQIIQSVMMQKGWIDKMIKQFANGLESKMGLKLNICRICYRIRK